MQPSSLALSSFAPQFLARAVGCASYSRSVVFNTGSVVINTGHSRMCSFDYLTRVRRLAPLTASGMASGSSGVEADPSPS